MSKWKEMAFSDAVSVNPSVTFDKKDELPFVEMKDVIPSNKFCTWSQKRKLSGGARFHNGDTLFARITPCLENGKIAVVRSLPGGKGFGSTEFHVLRGKEGKTVTSFVYYLSRWKEVRDFAELNLHGTSGRQRFPSEAFKELILYFPTTVEQESIAEILSSLDDKIDLLHRQNQTLEQLAETMFRQWFVEEADDSWEELSLDQISEYLNGLALQKYPVLAAEKALPVIKIREMNQGITNSTDLCSAYIPEQYIINDGDILFSWSGSLDVVVWTGGKGALNQHLFKVSSRLYPKWLSYFSTRLFLPEFRDIAADKATTMGHIQRKHLTEARLRIPHSSKMQEYNLVIDPLFSKLIHNSLQIKQLEQTRDILLPKLMSGAVRVVSS